MIGLQRGCFLGLFTWVLIVAGMGAAMYKGSAWALFPLLIVTSLAGIALVVVGMRKGS